MPDDQDSVQISLADIGPAIPLAKPIPEGTFYKVTTLDFMAKEPSRFGRMFKGGDGISVSVDPSPEAGGASQWYTQVRFPKGTDFNREFARTGLEWPVWWAIPEMTHLIEKARILEFVAFASPELALPWFIRLHAAAAGADPNAPVTVVRSVKTPMRAEYDEIDDLDDLVDDVRSAEHSDALKQSAYADWKGRAAEQTR
jgi:hypothetical protein